MRSTFLKLLKALRLAALLAGRTRLSRPAPCFLCRWVKPLYQPVLKPTGLFTPSPWAAWIAKRCHAPPAPSPLLIPWVRRVYGARGGR